MANLEQVKEEMFLLDNLMFRTFCTFKMVMNNKMHCTVRYYKGDLEYNQDRIDEISNQELYEELALLMLRVMLRHTTERKPEDIDGAIITVASEMVMNGFYDMRVRQLADLGQYPKGKDLVWYAYRIQHDLMMGNSVNEQLDKLRDKIRENSFQSNNGRRQVISMPSAGVMATDMETGGEMANEEGEEEEEGEGSGISKNGGNGKGDKKAQEIKERTKEDDDYDSLNEYSEGWEEDHYKQEEVKKLVQDTVLSGQGWGHIKGDMIEKIKATLEPKVDYKTMLQGFTTSITSSNRRLTRLRPNRRTGFLNMGSKRDLRSNVLLAVDTSGSVSSESLRGFYSIMMGIFKFGATDLQVMQFDHDVQKEPEPIKKAAQEIEINGRGGTSFQCVVDYLYKDRRYKKYDGLIYFTDGECSVPHIPAGFNLRILWLLDSKRGYDNYRKELGQTGRVCWMDLDTELVKVNL